MAWSPHAPYEFAIANRGSYLPAFAAGTDPGAVEGDVKTRWHVTVKCPTSVAYSPDPLLAVASRTESRVLIWRLPMASGAKKRSLSVDESPVKVEFSVDGALLLVGTAMSVALYDSAKLTQVPWHAPTLARLDQRPYPSPQLDSIAGCKGIMAPGGTPRMCWKGRSP